MLRLCYDCRLISAPPQVTRHYFLSPSYGLIIVPVDRVVWYSSMLGKKSSLKAVLRILQAEGITNVSVF